MVSRRLLWRSMALLIVLLSSAGCTSQAALRHLSPAEQAEWQMYRQVMSAGQERGYLAKASPAERLAYLRELGLAQRFQALEARDREALMAGQPVRGMSATGLRLLWGEPYATQGRSNHFEQWFYLGTSLALATWGNDWNTFSNRVVVHLDQGRVTDWLDFVPTTEDGSGGGWGE